MEYIVISDLHGSLEAANIVIEAIKHHNINRVLCLGDILYHGPRNTLPIDYNPKEVINILNSVSNKITAIKGNCDSEVDQMVLQFPILADYNQFYIGNKKLFMTHGHIYSTENTSHLDKGDIFLFGHVHLPIAEIQNDIYILNPGSSSLPKQNHPKTYAILNDNGFIIYTFDHKIYKEIAFK